MDVDKYAFELLGTVLAEDGESSIEYVAFNIMATYNLPDNVARDISRKAFEKWVEVYYPT